MDFTESFSNTNDMVAAAQQFITKEAEQIRFVNLRYTLYNEEESRWLYHVDFRIADNRLVVWESDTGEELIQLPIGELYRLKIRPYYYAACVGFKNLVFVVNGNNETEVQYEP